MKRIWHHWEKWECVPAGMYETLPPDGISSDDAPEEYRKFLSDLPRFESALFRVLIEWPISCEQFLSNPSINHIAWLGQASMCIETGVPACFRAGFKRLTDDQQAEANALADNYRLIWEHMHKRINHYKETWAKRGYPDDLPEEVPPELMRLGLAPSYKAICLAILKNDHACASLGYSQPVSPWYSAIKKTEIESRQSNPQPKKASKKPKVIAEYVVPDMFSNLTT